MNPLQRLLRYFQNESLSDLFQYYIALGDSISTDDYPGKGRGAASLFYRNRDDLFPEFRGNDLRTHLPGIRFQCLAQDGATTFDVLQHQLSRLHQNPSARILFTLTAGGNDILALAAGPEEITSGIRSILSQLQQRFPNCVALLGTIYDPTDDVGNLINPEISLTRELKCLKETNAGIREMSDPPKVLLIDIYQHFLGHGLFCKDPRNPFHCEEDPSLWYMMNIEPNGRGAHEVRYLFWDALARQLSHYE